MKRIFLLAILFASTSSFAKEAKTIKTFISHMEEVNKEWLIHPEAAKDQLVSFSSDTERISAHLKAVVASLSKSNHEYSGQELLNRQRLLRELDIYAERKIFPINNKHEQRTPYFIDDFGTHCAVGYLIKVSGNENLALSINSNNRFDYIREIDSPKMLVWAQKHGFSLEELAWIQPGYQVQKNYVSVDGGAHGAVHTVLHDASTNRTYISGEFDELGANHIDCGPVAFIQDLQVFCISGGVEGTVNNMILRGPNDLVVGGQFVDQGQNYSFANYNGATWSYFNISGREGAQGYAFKDISSPEGMILAVEEGEIFELHEYINNEWLLTLDFHGRLNAFETNGNQRFFGGDFDSVTVQYPAGSEPTLNLKNLLIETGAQGFAGLNDLLFSSEILDFSVNDNQLYVSGAAGVNGIALSKIDLQTNSIDIVFDTTTIQQTNPLEMFISKMEWVSDKEMIVSGSFNTSSGMDFGKNLGIYFKQFGLVQPISALNGPVYDFYWTTNRLIVGGDFSNDGVGNNANNLAYSNGFASLEESEKPSVLVYPNPAKEEINLANPNGQLDKVEVINVLGQVMKVNVIQRSDKAQTIDIKSLKPGRYFIKYLAGSEIQHSSFVKVH